MTRIVFKFNTVGDLLDELATIAKDPLTQDALDATVDGPDGASFTGFRIESEKLSDKSVVMNFYLTEEE